LKTIGLIGGTSWTSTIEYYRYINEAVAGRLGGLHSAKMVLANVDFYYLEEAMRNNKWDVAASILKREAVRLHAAGVDCILMCSNLIHKMFDEVQASVPVPLLHIGDALAEEIKARQYKCVALLGAKPTMEDSFYAARIHAGSGAQVLVPSPEDRDYMHTAIFGRMCCNVYTDGDRARFRDIIDELKKRGAEGVILGCTELPILLTESSLPLLNSTFIHCKRAVDWALV
jgi:aspartate racemase